MTVGEPSQRTCHQNDDAKLCTSSSLQDDPNRRLLLVDLSWDFLPMDSVTSSEAAQAIQDLSDDPEKGKETYQLFLNLDKYWHHKPFLLHFNNLHVGPSSSGTLIPPNPRRLAATTTTAKLLWITRFFMLDHHLRQICSPYISDHHTNNILSNHGTHTDTWLFSPISKPSPSNTPPVRKSQKDWAVVQCIIILQGESY